MKRNILCGMNKPHNASSHWEAKHGREPTAPVTAHKELSTFLRALLMHLQSQERQQLCDRLDTAERKGKCIRRAVFMMIVLFMASGAGLGYCAILLPELLRSPSHLLVRSLLVLGLGSLISQVVFLCHLASHRTAVNRLHGECRRLVLAVAPSQLQVPALPTPAVNRPGEFPRALAIAPPRQRAVSGAEAGSGG